MNEIQQSSIYAQILIAMLGACIWYLMQLILEHRGYSRKICAFIDRIFDKSINIISILLTKKNEYRKIILSDMCDIESSWKKLIFFTKSLIRIKPQSNIPDLKEDEKKRKAD